MVDIAPGKTMKILYPLAKRFIAGQDVVSMLKNIVYIGETTINYVGESCNDEKTIQDNIKEYEYLIYHLRHGGPEKHYELSVKLSQFGETPEQWKIAINRLLTAAKNTHIDIKLDMEKSSSISDTLDFVKDYKDILGIVLQANMERSYDDLNDVIGSYRPLRICKGAYKGDIAKNEDIRVAYLELVEKVFKHKFYLMHKDRQGILSLATHDEFLIKKIKELAEEYKVKDKFIFEFLYGIRRDLLHRLRFEGYRVRTYVPYGKNWLSYVCRRLMEFKNLKFVGINVIKEYYGNLWTKSGV